MTATSVRASWAEPTDVLVLADGTRLRLRPLSCDDRDCVAALFARLTPESRYRRFLSPKRELTPRELAYLTDIDHIHLKLDPLSDWPESTGAKGLVAVDLVGLFYREAARSLHTREATITTRLHRGRQHVAGELIALA